MVALRDASVSFGARTSWWDRAFMPPGSRPEQALHEASLEVAEGCVMAVCGVSGSGKSTLLRLCEGDLAPTAGSVELRCCPCLIDGGVLQRLEGKLKRAGTDYIISMWPQEAYLGTLLTKSLLSALSCPAIDLPSPFSGSRTVSFQPWGG